MMDEKGAPSTYLRMDNFFKGQVTVPFLKNISFIHAYFLPTYRFALDDEQHWYTHKTPVSNFNMKTIHL